MFGCGALAQQVLSGGTHGVFLTANLAFGFAATLGILVCGQVSGRQTESSAKNRPNKFLLTWVDVMRSECCISSAKCQRKQLANVYIKYCIVHYFYCYYVTVVQVDIWTLQWHFHFVCLEENAGGSSPCSSSFRQLVHFLVLLWFLACTTVRGGCRWWDTYIFYTIKPFCLIAILDALWDFPGCFNMTETTATAGIFATYPANHLTIVNGFFDQVLFLST